MDCRAFYKLLQSVLPDLLYYDLSTHTATVEVGWRLWSSIGYIRVKSFSDISYETQIQFVVGVENEVLNVKINLRQQRSNLGIVWPCFGATFDLLKMRSISMFSFSLWFTRYPTMASARSYASEFIRFCCVRLPKILKGKCKGYLNHVDLSKSWPNFLMLLGTLKVGVHLSHWYILLTGAWVTSYQWWPVLRILRDQIWNLLLKTLLVLWIAVLQLRCGTTGIRL